MDNIPPPTGDQDSGILAAYTLQGNQELGEKELRYVIIRTLLERLPTIVPSTIESHLDIYIIPAARRIEKYMNSGE